MGASPDPTVRATERRTEFDSQGAGSTYSMGVKRQQGKGDQKDLFDEALKASLRHGVSGESGTGAGTQEEQQAHTVWAEDRALTQHQAALAAVGNRRGT